MPQKNYIELSHYLIAHNCKPVRTYSINKMNMPQLLLSINQEEDREIFNHIYLTCFNDPECKELETTFSGGISMKANKQLFAYKVWRSSYNIDLVVKAAGYFRIIIQNIQSHKPGEHLSGHQSFYKLQKELLKDGVDIKEYAIENGADVKKEILKPLIKAETGCIFGKTYLNCHHIDYHQSYPAGLVNTHPEFEKTMTRLYLGRNMHPMNKDIMDMSIGYMQSGIIKYKYAHLARDAMNDNWHRVTNLAEKVKAAGFQVLLYNTDGFWYVGKNGAYHGEGEGNDMGQWQNDHVDCTLRIKSPGAYEFMERKKYTPVLRGKTNLDLKKPREEWVWGDIFNTAADEVIRYQFIEGEGIVEVTTDKFGEEE